MSSCLLSSCHFWRFPGPPATVSHPWGITRPPRGSSPRRLGGGERGAEMIPKPQRVRDSRAIEAARKPWCEYCGRSGRTQVHHIKSRGSGGGDEAQNLVALCVVCHARAHAGQTTKDQLREIVRRREHGASVSV
ncbi:MAG: HNH endonuclease signature motif containing protein [Bacteroidota bacterium]